MSEAGILLTRRFVGIYETAVREAAAQAGLCPRLLVLDNAIGATIEPELRDAINIAFLSGDLQRGNTSGFMRAIEHAPNLRWLQSFGVGVDVERFGPLLARGVRLSNAVGVNSVPIAHHAITGLLMLSRRFTHYNEAQRRHDWRPLNWDSPDAPYDLDTETLVIVGLGAVGSQIARVAKALGLTVIGVRRRPKTGDDSADLVVTPRDLDSVLPRANWVVLSCTLTEETRGLIDRRRLALLPRGARLINVARGAIVDEGALIESLASGHLGGAYLDVVQKEPLAPDSPLWDMANVIISPHNAAASRGKFAREADLFLRNLVRFGRGEPLINEVFEP